MCIPIANLAVHLSPKLHVQPKPPSCSCLIFYDTCTGERRGFCHFQSRPEARTRGQKHNRMPCKPVKSSYSQNGALGSGSL